MPLNRSCRRVHQRDRYNLSHLLAVLYVLVISRETTLRGMDTALKYGMPSPLVVEASYVSGSRTAARAFATKSRRMLSTGGNGAKSNRSKSTNSSKSSKKLKKKEKPSKSKSKLTKKSKKQPQQQQEEEEEEEADSEEQPQQPIPSTPTLPPAIPTALPSSQKPVSTSLSMPTVPPTSQKPVTEQPSTATALPSSQTPGTMLPSSLPPSPIQSADALVVGAPQGTTSDFVLNELGISVKAIALVVNSGARERNIFTGTGGDVGGSTRRMQSTNDRFASMDVSVTIEEESKATNMQVSIWVNQLDEEGKF